MRLSKKGQSTIEYILLVTAAIVVILTFATRGGPFTQTVESSLNLIPKLIFPPECGDADGNYQIDEDDIYYLIDYMFRGGEEPFSMPESDLNGDGDIDIGDISFLINHLFLGGPAPTCGA